LNRVHFIGGARGRSASWLPLLFRRGGGAARFTESVSGRSRG
jgi:hypothetical protein